MNNNDNTNAYQENEASDLIAKNQIQFQLNENSGQSSKTSMFPNRTNITPKLKIPGPIFTPEITRDYQTNKYLTTHTPHNFENPFESIGSFGSGSLRSLDLPIPYGQRSKSGSSTSVKSIYYKESRNIQARSFSNKENETTNVSSYSNAQNMGNASQATAAKQEQRKNKKKNNQSTIVQSSSQVDEEID